MSVRIGNAKQDDKADQRDDNDVGPTDRRRRTVALLPYSRGHRHVWRYPFDLTQLRLRT